MKRSTTSGFAGLCRLLTGCQVLTCSRGCINAMVRLAEEKLPLL